MRGGAFKLLRESQGCTILYCCMKGGRCIEGTFLSESRD